MKYNFDKVIDRKKYNSTKWNEVDHRFGADGLLPLWVADMDFRVPEPVIKALEKRAKHGVFGYVTEPDSYYEAIINWFMERYSFVIKKDWIAYTPSVVSALSLLINTFSLPNDKIIIQPPIYYPFIEVIKKNNRQIVFNPLRLLDGSYYMDFEDLKKKIDSQVKMIIICNPHNPVGRVWKRDELLGLAEICLENNIMIVADEVHADIIYKGNKYTALSSLSEELAEKCISCHSPNKTFNLAGLQSSYLLIPNKKYYDMFKETMERIHLIKNNVFGTIALEAAYNFGKDWLTQLLAYLEGNLDYLEQFVNQKLPGVNFVRPEGTYLAWLDFTNLGLDKDGLHNLLIRKARVALNDGYIYGKGGEGFERLNFACPQVTLEKCLKKISTVI